MSDIVNLMLDLVALIENNKYHKHDTIGRSDPTTKPAFNHMIYYAETAVQLLPINLDYSSSGFMVIRNMDEVNTVCIGSDIGGNYTVKILPGEGAIYKPYGAIYIHLLEINTYARVEFLIFDVVE
jgi:hypothetical protein